MDSSFILVKKALRTQIGIILETGEAREVHHHCLLIGYGADGINPYLAFESLCKSRLDGLTNQESFPDDISIISAYKKGVAKGILKVLAKMGISTLQSYKGAQVFEAIGLKDEVIDLAFNGTASRVQGVGFDVIFEEILRRHSLGFPDKGQKLTHDLINPGEFHWRAEGEVHAWNPESISYLQKASSENNIKSYELFSKHINAHSKAKSTLRGLMDFSFNETLVNAPLTNLNFLCPIKENGLKSTCLSERVDLSKNTKLEYVWFANNKLIDINLKNLEFLEELQLIGNQLETIDLSDNPYLRILRLGENYFSSFDIYFCLLVCFFFFLF